MSGTNHMDPQNDASAFKPSGSNLSLFLPTSCDLGLMAILSKAGSHNAARTLSHGFKDLFDESKPALRVPFLCFSPTGMGYPEAMMAILRNSSGSDLSENHS